MKPVLKLSIPFLLGVLISSISYGYAVPVPGADARESTVHSDVRPSPFKEMSVQTFLSLTPKQYRQLTGKKLSILQKLSLKLAQSRVKKLLRKNRHIDLEVIARDIETNQFSILGFILGVVLGPLGILIAFLIEGKGSSTFTWSIIGGLVWLGLVLLVVLVL